MGKHVYILVHEIRRGNPGVGGSRPPRDQEHPRARGLVVLYRFRRGPKRASDLSYARKVRDPVSLYGFNRKRSTRARQRVFAEDLPRRPHRVVNRRVEFGSYFGGHVVAI